MGFSNTLVASMIRSLGVNIKTAVPMKVLESVRRGKVAIARVDVGCKLTSPRKKGRLGCFAPGSSVTSQNMVRRGVVVSVTSPVGDKFKLLKFDGFREVGGLELSLQEVSAKFDSVQASDRLRPTAPFWG